MRQWGDVAVLLLTNAVLGEHHTGLAEHMTRNTHLDQLLAAAAGPIAADVAVHGYPASHSRPRPHAASVCRSQCSGRWCWPGHGDALRVLGQWLATRPTGCVPGRRLGLGQLGLQRSELHLQAGHQNLGGRHLYGWLINHEGGMAGRSRNTAQIVTLSAPNNRWMLRRKLLVIGQVIRVGRHA